MAISDEERRIFEELQREIEETDPAFSRRMSRSSHAAKGTLINVGIFILGVIMMLSGVAIPNIFIGVGGFALMIYAGIRASTGKGIIDETSNRGTDIGPNLRL
jgi:hypothetical protein